jgi:hypothetical protein
MKTMEMDESTATRETLAAGEINHKCKCEFPIRIK